MGCGNCQALRDIRSKDPKRRMASISSASAPGRHFISSADTGSFKSLSGVVCTMHVAALRDIFVSCSEPSDTSAAALACRAAGVPCVERGAAVCTISMYPCQFKILALPWQGTGGVCRRGELQEERGGVAPAARGLRYMQELKQEGHLKI